MARKTVAEKEVMDSCLMCVVKHVFKARAKSVEITMGYPERYFSALGELAEAEAECVKDYPMLATYIRDQRLQWQTDCLKVPGWRNLAYCISMKLMEANKLPAHFLSECERVVEERRGCGRLCDVCPAKKRGRR